MRTLLLASLLLGCASKPTLRLDVMRVGQLRNSLPEDCKIEFLDAPAAAAMLLLTQVGMITAQVEAGHIDAALREEVRKKACGIGGDVITFNVGMSLGENRELVQFLVFRKPPPEEKEKPAAAPTGTSS